MVVLILANVSVSRTLHIAFPDMLDARLLHISINKNKPVVYNAKVAKRWLRSGDV